jgi:two-component system chemotaxis response regulator CheY
VLDVLIVDDSAAIRKILQRVLRQTEIPIGTVYEAGDGVEALETLRKQTIGLVLSDINMPNMDGLEFLTKMRAEQIWHGIPVLMVSTEGTRPRYWRRWSAAPPATSASHSPPNRSRKSWSG